jgi:hypothetical protein
MLLQYRIWFFNGTFYLIAFCHVREVAGYVKEKFWRETQEIYAQNDGSIIFEAEMPGTVEVMAGS